MTGAVPAWAAWTGYICLAAISIGVTPQIWPGVKVRVPVLSNLTLSEHLLQSLTQAKSCQALLDSKLLLGNAAASRYGFDMAGHKICC